MEIKKQLFNKNNQQQLFYQDMHPYHRNHRSHSNQMQDENKPKKVFSRHVFHLINQILFDQQVDTGNKFFVTNINNLNKQLTDVKIRQCVQVLEPVISAKDRLKLTISICDKVIQRCLDFKIRAVFLNAYINLMNKYKEYQKFGINLPKISYLSQKIILKDLPYYSQAFGVQLKPQIAQAAVDDLCKSSNYNLAFKLVSSQQKKELLLQIIQKYALNDKQKQTVQFITGEIAKLGYGKKDFQKLHQKGLQMQMDQIYHEEGFYYAEEVYSYNPFMMNIIAKKVLADPKINRIEKLSFCARNPNVLASIKDANLQHEVETLMQINPNPLRNDRFEPSDKKYMYLKQIGMKEEDIVFVNSQTPNLKGILQYIIQSDVLGLDTESYVARTKFCTESELIATIQISDGKKAFVFDAKNISNPLIGEVLSGFFLNPKKILVGHTLQDDLDVTLNALGIKEKAKCQCIDVKFDFKKLHPGKRAGLQSISEVILGKPICKNYTLTDWGRRPLLKNQLHYAALDAVVVIHIWRKIQQIKRNDAKRVHL